MMQSIITPFILQWVGMMAPGVLPQGDPPFGASVRIEVAPGPYYAGQGIALELRGDGQGREAAVEVPRLVDADLVPLGASSGAGRTDGESRPWARRYVVLPHRAGELRVGPFRVRDAAGQVSSTRPLQLGVKSVPQAGRSARFLGGVGGCRAVAAVEPARIRQGQPVEFRITLVGPGAWGSAQAPDLASWSGLAGEFEVRLTANRVEPGEPPSRTFRYRLRPRRAGPVVLPPVAVATFDPGSGRFETRATTGVPLVVEPPPHFDPATIELDLPNPATPPRPARRLALTAGTAILLGGVIVALLRRRRARHRADRPVSWRREAAALRRWSTSGCRGTDVTAEIAGRLTRGLARATGRPIAVLTPADAVRAIGEIGGNPDLAARVGALVVRVDRVRFDEEATANATGAEVEGLVVEAVAVFRAIGRSVRPSRPDRPTSPHPTGGDAG